MARGEHIYVINLVAGIPFQHHGIDMGDGTVIHLASETGGRVALRDSTGEFSVRRNSLEEFCQGRTPVIVTHDDGRDALEVAETAENFLGKPGYCVLDGNCEHFATLCATGRFESQQIEMSEAVFSAMSSLATKAFWSICGKLGTRLTVQGATKIHPAAMLADGVEIATLAISRQSGMTAARSRRLAKLSGTVAAAGIGVIAGGPAGAAVSLATHASSGLVADRLCKTVRILLASSS